MYTETWATVADSTVVTLHKTLAAAFFETTKHPDLQIYKIHIHDNGEMTTVGDPVVVFDKRDRLLIGPPLWPCRLFQLAASALALSSIVLAGVLALAAEYLAALGAFGVCNLLACYCFYLAGSRLFEIERVRDAFFTELFTLVEDNLKTCGRLEGWETESDGYDKTA